MTQDRGSVTRSSRKMKRVWEISKGLGIIERAAAHRAALRGRSSGLKAARRRMRPFCWPAKNRKSKLTGFCLTTTRKVQFGLFK
jgi:hypothetical protein